MNVSKKNKVLKDFIHRLKTLKKYEVSIGGGCECCGSWIEHSPCEYGEWVKIDDIENLINALEENIK